MPEVRSWTIRPAVPERDFAAIAGIMSEELTYEVTEAQLHEWEARHWDGLIRNRLVAEANGRVVGYGLSAHQPWDPPGQFEVWPAVTQAKRHSGIGAALYAAVLACARERGATVLTSEVQEGDTESMRFAERRGFAIDRHLFESQLDVMAFDEAPFAGTIEAVEARGIRFFSLADADTPEVRRALHKVNTVTALDIPGYTGGSPTYDEFGQMVFSASWFAPEGQILAADGDRMVGLTAIGYYPEQGLMVNNMTGVLSEYRGRRIALALKLLAIRLAKQKGVGRLRTSNDSENAPMLAINRKLGYVPEAGVYRLIRPL